ncbi:chromosome segregation protein SMC [Nakamurella antarctica]|uniref:Chromosome partition protein Smc n=1 Tax=Nakamurella antarctica TaxID=1902245 RepID=A0A3G8ZQU1_9ACTN|nr:chromosome segregation protein SMC [Nakamurella antarctica]
MYLKSLTLKGFKSFASATTLNFEPGITAVVGPNGSGKSNVVDAIAWVLGEQGAKALRGGKMEDVIFAGTASRPPLGRAEVTLTINNADGALPIDYNEVAITRRMFAGGASEYELNGSTCRLLDIQELLSDSGIGREMHVIVGQGQLDAVLSARPEDRRAFIEEAAGVLKHRKRKEKALRKLDAMQANLTRLGDLTSELRRQLKPLGKQAEVARRAVTVQSELREARLRLLADDLVTLQTQVEKETADEQQAKEHRNRIAAELEAATNAEATAQRELSAAAPAMQEAQDTWFALSALAERLRSTLNLAQERARSLTAQGGEVPRSGRDPEDLDAAAEAAEIEQEEKEEAVENARAELAEAVSERSETEAMHKAAERELLAATAAIADRREGLAKLTGQASSVRSRLTAIGEETNRLSLALGDAHARADQADAQFETLQESVGELGEFEVGLDEAHEEAAAASDSAAARVAELTEAGRESRARQAALQARVDALALGLNRRDGSAVLLAQSSRMPGLLGSVATVLTVSAGAEAALASALGAISDAVAVVGVAEAAAALALLRQSQSGRAGLLVGGGPPLVDRLTWPQLPVDATWAIDLVQAPQVVLSALTKALDRVAVTADVASAQKLVEQLPEVRAVSRDGDLLGSDWAVGGSAGKQSVLELQAALDSAAAELADVTAKISSIDAALSGARAEAELRARDAAAALAALGESDAQMSAVGEELGRLAEISRSAAAEAERLVNQRETAEHSRVAQEEVLAELELRLGAAESDETPASIDTSVRDELADAVAVKRQAEMEWRLTLRTAEERARATTGAAEGLRRQAKAERESRVRAEAARIRRAASAAVANKVAFLADQSGQHLSASLDIAHLAREESTAARAAAELRAQSSRSRLMELSSAWEKLTTEVHRDEVLRAQQSVRIEQLVEKITDEFALTVEDLIAEYGPHVPVPASAAEMAEYEAARAAGESVTAPQPMAYEREAQQRNVKRGERDLALLGKVNPLALEEFSALEERHAFLATQLEDLKDTRRDLLTVVGEVDGKILEVFTSAYHDVAREFVTVFATLFPGGEGELVLTNPDDMLTTGIEVHARPPGKKVKRLSLLSGGERSLTAVAILVAIFRARPSPFYIMDEVEAALDETNLNRLVGLLTELRDSSQLIIITHQKFTMESADALYGVSMRGDGITQVISQRIRGRDAEAAVQLQV